MEKKIENGKFEWIDILVTRAKEKGTDYDLWMILTALRGPDGTTYETNSLKMLTTVRIRAIVGVHTYIPVDVNRFELTNKDIEKRNKLLRGNFHFNYHFENAMVALDKLGYNVPEEELNFDCKQSD